jgi:hypothetical protein
VAYASTCRLRTVAWNWEGGPKLGLPVLSRLNHKATGLVVKNWRIAMSSAKTPGSGGKEDEISDVFKIWTGRCTQKIPR